MSGYRLALFVLILAGVALMFAGIAVDALSVENERLRLVLHRSDEPEPPLEGSFRDVTPA